MLLVLNADAGYVLAFAWIQLVVVRNLLDLPLSIHYLACCRLGRRRGRRHGRRSSFVVVDVHRTLGGASIWRRARLVIVDLLPNDDSRFRGGLVRPTTLRSWQLQLRRRIRVHGLLFDLVPSDRLRGQTWLVVWPEATSAARYRRLSCRCRETSISNRIKVSGERIFGMISVD